MRMRNFISMHISQISIKNYEISHMLDNFYGYFTKESYEPAPNGDSQDPFDVDLNDEPHGHVSQSSNAIRFASQAKGDEIFANWSSIIYARGLRLVPSSGTQTSNLC